MRGYLRGLWPQAVRVIVGFCRRAATISTSLANRVPTLIVSCTTANKAEFLQCAAQCNARNGIGLPRRLSRRLSQGDSRRLSQRGSRRLAPRGVRRSLRPREREMPRRRRACAPRAPSWEGKLTQQADVIAGKTKDACLVDQWQCGECVRSATAERSQHQTSSCRRNRCLHLRAQDGSLY